METWKDSAPDNQNNENDLELGSLLNEVNDILDFSAKKEKEVMFHFGKGAKVTAEKNFGFKKLEHLKTFAEEDIKSNCLRFRLRFLPTNHFSGKIPYEVITVIKKFELKFENQKNEFFILAPSDFFLLKDRYSDPLLFVKNGDRSFTLLCQWGKDFAWYIPFLMYPLRNFKSMVISSLITGVFVAILVGVFGFLNDPNWVKSILFKVPVAILTAGLFSTLGLCYGLITYTDYSSENWKSVYFN
jgi:hypothetical protein